MTKAKPTAAEKAAQLKVLADKRAASSAATLAMMIPLAEAEWEKLKAREHSENIGRIVLAMGQCNKGPTADIEHLRWCHDVIGELNAMDAKTAAGIVAQLPTRT
jgi:hypothetical protein